MENIVIKVDLVEYLFNPEVFLVDNEFLSKIDKLPVNGEVILKVKKCTTSKLMDFNIFKEGEFVYHFENEEYASGYSSLELLLDFEKDYIILKLFNGIVNEKEKELIAQEILEYNLKILKEMYENLHENIDTIVIAGLPGVGKSFVANYLNFINSSNKNIREVGLVELQDLINELDRERKTYKIFVLDQVSLSDEFENIIYELNNFEKISWLNYKFISNNYLISLSEIKFKP